MTISNRLVKLDVVIKRGSVRRKSKDIFQKVLRFRKQGLSYSEIRKETGIAKSTINNWLTFAGFTLTKEHLLIQEKKRLENHVIATEASKITRQKRKEADIQNFIQTVKKYFSDPFFVGGILLYESEGSKGTDCKFSNSDYRLIQIFIKFIEKYLALTRLEDMSFAIYIHDTRSKDIGKIKRFWSRITRVPSGSIKVYWKRNKIVGRRDNPEYLGQFTIRVKGGRILGSKLLAVSDIILRKYLRN